MAENKGTKVIAPIVTPSTDDKFPTHISNMGKGGYHSVATLTERDAISTDRREEGMLCYVVAEGVGYQLIGGLENSNWTIFSVGGDGSDITNAGAVVYTPTGNLEATNVQSALDELDVEKAGVEDVYTKAEVDTLVGDVQTLVEDLEVDYNDLLNQPDLSSLHEHLNAETVDKFEEVDGKLTWNGAEIGGVVDPSSINISGVPYDIDNADSKSLKEIIDGLLYVAPVITAFSASPSVVEKGTAVDSLALSWTINKDITEQSINQGIGVLEKSLRTHTVTSGVTDNTSYILTVTDGQNSVNRTTSVSFRSKLYYGVSALTALTNADLLTLNGELATSKAKTVSFNPTSQYIYVAFPTSFGTAKFKVNGLDNDAWVVSAINHTNSQGFVEGYTIYRSEFLQNGSGINIEIS